MAQASEAQPDSPPLATIGPGQTSRRFASKRSLVVWTVAASLLLVGSGIVRAVQSSSFAAESRYLVECPFPLSTIPRTIGEWQVLNGSETVLDPLTTRITGSTDHIVRTYVDEMTGVMLSVLVLFGPAEPVLPHTPQICYPSSGFQALGDPVDRNIKISDDESATFRCSIFAKSGGRMIIRNAVYHSFLLQGPWTPAIANQKFPRKNPGIFKVQIQRRVSEGEKLENNEPIEEFIQKLLPILEKMTAEAVAARNQTTASPART